MKEFKKHGLYTKVSEEECWRATGKGPIGTRWVDINIGDEDRPEYRSRLVAKELKTDKREDLFAATPPIEALKLLISMAMTEGIGYQRGHEAQGSSSISSGHTYKHRHGGHCMFSYLLRTLKRVGAPD